MRETNNGGESARAGHQRRARDTEAQAAELQSEGEELVETIAGAAQDAGNLLRANAAERPYVSLGVAAGVGFLLAGGISSKLTSALLGFGGRLLLTAVLNEAEKRTH